MSRSGPDTDRKRRPAPARALAKDATKQPSRAGAIDRDRKGLGAILRPPAPAVEAAVAAPKGRIKVGAKDDPAEAEADRIAKEIVAKPRSRDDPKAPKDAEEGDETDLRPGLARGPPPATNVIALPGRDTGTLRRVAAQGSQPNLDSLSATPALPANQAEVSVAATEQSQLGDFEEGDFATLSEGAGVQAKYAPGQGGAGFALPESLAAQLRAPSGGQALQGGLRTQIEDRLALVLAPLRLHSDTQSGLLCRAIGARAFAYGRHVWLRSPAEMCDRHLIAHEVVHVAQQRALPRRAPRPRHGHGARRTERHGIRAPPATTAAPALRRLLGVEDGLLARGAEQMADRVEAYGLIKAVSGRRLFTGETVPSGAMEFTGVFLRFVGQAEVYDNLRQSGALEKGFREIRQGLDDHDLNWDRISRTFRQAVDQFDLLSPIDSLMRVFAPFLSDIRAFAVIAVKAVGRLIVEAFIAKFGPMGRAVWERIQSIGDSIDLIVANPMGFAQNLIRAVARGVQGFGERIWTHIKAGLLAWVLGPLAEMGVQLPEKLDLRGVIGVILQVLGLTYPQLRPRIVKALDPHGEVKVSVIERIVEIVNILRTEGLAGLWRKILDYVQNLQTTVMNGIRDWVVRAVVQAGIRKLVAWSNPAGALIDILLTIYNLIAFFVEKLQQILDFAASVFDSLAKIARGELDDAARLVEASMARTIPIIISFLVGLLGLPDIGGTIRSIITALRARVHAAFDKMLKWIIDKVKKLIASLIDRFASKNKPKREKFTMNGESHELWAENDSGKVRVMMASGQGHEVEADDAAETQQAVAESADAKLPGVKEKTDAIAKAHAELMDEVKAQGGKPANNAKAPAARGKMDAKIAALAPALQAGAEPPPKAVDADKQEPVASGAEGQTAVDRTVFPMRRCVRDTGKVEGAAGTWQEMTQKYDAAKAAAPSPADIYANLARDHIAEFSILSRVSRIVTPKMMRKGKSADTPLFPALRDAVKNAGTASSGNPDLPVIILRSAINTRISATSTLLKGWDTAFRAKGENWQSQEPPPANDQDVAAQETKLQTTYGAEALIADMQSHIEKIIEEYSGLPKGTVEGDFADHVTAKAVPVLKELVRAAFGSATGAKRSEEGVGDTLNIPYDKDMAEGELQMDSYDGLKSFKLGNHLQRHHLVEENVTSKLRDRARDLTLGHLWKDPATLAGTEITKAVAALPVETRTKLDARGGEWRQMLQDAMAGAIGAAPAESGFNKTQSTKERGTAVIVLSSINQQAGTQADTVDARLEPIHARLGAAHAGALSGAVGQVLAELLPLAAEGRLYKPPTLKTRFAAAAATVETGLRPGLSQSWQEVLRDLTTAAYGTFQQLQSASIAEIAGPKDNEEMVKTLKSRLDTKATLDAFISHNRNSWFGT